MTGRLRYAFAISRGSNAGLGCGGWRVWTHDESTYITTKGLRGTWKASLHADDAWRVAVTKEHDQSGKHPILPGLHRDAPWEFMPTKFKDGGRLAFVIAVTRAALTRQPIDPREVVIEVADRWDRMTELYILMTEPGVGLDSHNCIGGPLPLTSGRQVWVTFAEEVIKLSDPQPVPVSQMVQVMSPEADDFTAPGFLVRGVYVG